MWCTPEYDDTLFHALRMFNARRVRYILGVVPYEMTWLQAIALKAVMAGGSGSVVMHGFSHGYASPALRAQQVQSAGWHAQYTTMMAGGGEFSGMSMERCDHDHLVSHKILQQSFGSLYDPAHFIAPFNCYTQALLDALDETEIKFLHTCDKEYNEYKYAGLNYRNIKPVVSRLYRGYDYAGNVAGKLPDVLKAGEQITLHWYYDCYKKSHWKDEYARLLDALAKEPEYVTPA